MRLISYNNIISAPRILRDDGYACHIFCLLIPIITAAYCKHSCVLLSATHIHRWYLTFFMMCEKDRGLITTSTVQTIHKNFCWRTPQIKVFIRRHLAPFSTSSFSFRNVKLLLCIQQQSVPLRKRLRCCVWGFWAWCLPWLRHTPSLTGQATAESSWQGHFASRSLCKCEPINFRCKQTTPLILTLDSSGKYKLPHWVYVSRQKRCRVSCPQGCGFPKADPRGDSLWLTSAAAALCCLINLNPMDC